MAYLLLSDGTKIEGKTQGYQGVGFGTLSFYNAADYIDDITSPANAGRITAYTIPELGIWGANTEHCETGKPWQNAIITRNMCAEPMNWRSAEPLDYFLHRNKTPCISGIDTLSLQKYAEENNIKKCAVVTTKDADENKILEDLKATKGGNLFPNSIKSPETFGPQKSAICNVAICDFGASFTLVKFLASLRMKVTLLPPYDAAEIVARSNYDGLIIPNGSGLPRNHPGITQSLKTLINANFPLLGYGLGYLYIAAAVGGKIQPLQIPKRGALYPVADAKRTYFTRQYSDVFVETLPEEIEITHRNACDETICGFNLSKCTARQYIPFSDLRLGGTGEMFFKFMQSMKGGEVIERDMAATL